ncbi:MAG: diphosphomevalonate decarboxylase [Gammaproteobacteria bacterium]
MNTPGTRVSAQAQPNIALIKYWGKRDAGLNIPAAGSLSVTLDALHTRTEVSFNPALDSDEVVFNGRHGAAQSARISVFLDLLRARASRDWRAIVVTDNDFPTAAGLASSASGFAALALAASRALGLALDAPALSALARRGSGSAARSIFGGFVEMQAGQRADGEDAVAAPLLEPQAWPLRVVIAVTTRAAKDLGSSAGMELSRRSSPFYSSWIDAGADDLADAHAAVLTHDFEKLAVVSEASCLKMHAVMLSSRPGLMYWNAATVECLQCVRALREGEGLGVFFTVDAGPQVKAVCLPEAVPQVTAALGAVRGVKEVLVSALGAGARLLAPNPECPDAH